jgi:hypothetical protein
MAYKLGFLILSVPGAAKRRRFGCSKSIKQSERESEY